MSDARDEPLIEAPALRAQVYRRLHDEILGGDISPGSRVSPAGIARRFGVSTMPVREALRLLEDEGLVETAARRWTRVVELEPSLVEEILPLVSLLETYAVSSAPERSGAGLGALQSANVALEGAIARGDLRGIIEADTAFHDSLVALAANRSLERALRDSRTRIRLLRNQVLGLEGATESLDEHEAIVEALYDGDREKAAQLVRTNWERGLARFRASLAP